jgi:signal transduction histidine kinase
MGSRGRSIRLSIYAMVAIPLVTMVGLFGVVAYKTVNNAVNLDRAPSLIRATSEPMAEFTNFLQDERRAALVYLSAPNAANLTAYKSTVSVTESQDPGFAANMSSSATKTSSDATETAAIDSMINAVQNMTPLRNEVLGRAITPLDALAAYTDVITLEEKVFFAESDSLTDATASQQSLGLIGSVAARESLEEEDAVLAGALAAGTLSVENRAAFDEVAAERQANLLDTTTLLDSANKASFEGGLNKDAPAALQEDLTKVEGAIVDGFTLRQLEAQGLSSATWQQLMQSLEAGYFAGGVDTASTELVTDSGISAQAWDQVVYTSIAGSIGLILTLIVTIVVGRSIIRRLGRLRGTALSLANEQLPSVIGRLRRGEPVDIVAEAPPLSMGGDEIGQVGQAFDTVRQTALRAAIEEARLRQGISDVFRNLARRNQSLLHRQLTVLDAMERRATDPEALDDLFRLDHLTTRMRRHAEGLIILSGAPPGRSWSSPVKMIDVMRGAVAEVEDYARVNVVTQTKAALSGSAVTDLIHLLAELIENATSLSPPYTNVRVSGELVPHGFAIEIEDRGLGMSPARLAELNERLSHPPEFNPSNTEQLGLFVVSQLAHRHGVQVMLRLSPYGGTTAIVLIPRGLVVAEEALTAGQGFPGGPGAMPGPGGMPGAGMPPFGQPGPWGPVPAGAGPGMAGAGFSNGPGPGGPGGNGFGPPQNRFVPNGGIPNGGVPNGGIPNGGVPNGGIPNGGVPNGGVPNGGVPNGGIPNGGVPNGGIPNGGAPNGGIPNSGVPNGGVPNGGIPNSGAPSGGAPSGFGPAPFAANRQVPSFNGPNDAPQPPFPPTDGAADTSYGPGIRISGAVRRQMPTNGGPGAGKIVPGHTEPPEPPPFDVFTRSASGPSGAEGSSTTGNGASGTGPMRVGPPELPASPSTATVRSADGDELPRRVRQANLAPQLRKDKAQPNSPSAGPSPAAEPSPMSLSEIRTTMSAMQRGWQQARAEAAQQSDGEPIEGQES